MFKPKEYEYSSPFHGKAAEAFNVARTALLSLGFEILLDSGTELHAEGPGMHSNQQPELLGVSLLRLRIASSKITAAATLGGVATMKTFIYLFPPGLAVALLLTFGFMGMGISWFHTLWVLPWIFIAPLMGAALERKTIRAVERLVRGMANVR
ncbi:MAG: hypothetical protein GY862_07300 [Gammaproteobacteria bacterium]|nr:hypothetical protein [Gammaproteobacteria bacterium]